MRSASKGIKTMTDMPAKRTNCAHATKGGAEDLSTFHSRFDMCIHDFSSEVNEIKHACSVKD